MKHLKNVSRAQSGAFCSDPQSQTDSLLCFLFLLLTEFFVPILNKDSGTTA